MTKLTFARIPGLSAMTVLCLLIAATSPLFTQAPAQPSAAGPTFEVVSINRNTSGALGSNGSNQRPDGGFALLNAPIMTLIGRAYPPAIPLDMIGLPEWATRDRYDVRATSSLSRPATEDERAAMLRAMLAERFKLVAHVETREQAVYDLVLARSDGRLGPGISPSGTDCVAKRAADRAAAEAGLATATPSGPATPFDAPPPTCGSIRMGNGMEGDMTLENFAFLLRSMAGRPVVDKTALSGSFRIKIQFDRAPALREPDTVPSPDRLPSLFTALPEQLGLKLESSKAERDVLVIDRLERPTEN